MQKLKEYLFFNPQYGNLSKNQLMFQYKKDHDNSNIIKSFSEFKKKYPNFNVSFYKNCYSDLKEKDTRSLLIHWLQYGVYITISQIKKIFIKNIHLLILTITKFLNIYIFLRKRKRMLYFII